MQYIVCPICKEPLEIYLSSSVCKIGHKFQVIDGILDLLPHTKDSNLLIEEKHWNDVADKGKMKIVPDKYISTRIVEDYRTAFEECVESAWSGNFPSKISLADIGCGSGSAIRYLNCIGFENVDYVGIDVSIKSMSLCRRKELLPNNWNVRFIRASGNSGLFKESSLDIVFSASALHHMDLNSVMEWVSKSLKPNGLLILHEPSSKNLFAKIGRRFVHDFHTKGEKPMEPANIKELAKQHNLSLVYEKGLHYLSGSLQYLMGILKFPFPFVFCIYHMSRFIDTLILSPSWNYSFIQAYRKE
jgi:SAM-dependent methyltransferase